MIALLYNLAVRTYLLGVKLSAAFKNAKAQAWLKGRKNWRQKLQKAIDPESSIIWIHAASVGEMEQGLPILSGLKAKHPTKKILVTFFSPSGFEFYKNSKIADYIFYLPLDTPKNAHDFINLVKPELALFIKYEIWVNFFLAVQKAKIPLILAPALFRENQFYFKSIAWPFFKPIFKNISHILVQNETSYKLLQSKGLSNIEVCGDTRFERVLELTKEPYPTEKLEEFIDNQFCLIGGSSWPKEEEILHQTLGDFPNFKLIVAPHVIDSENINRLSEMFAKFGLSKFSDQAWPKENRVLLVDNIGHLKKLYRVGDIAFIGGGFGKGVHSTIEAICYGIAVAFGPKHKKFVEPGEMMEHGIGFEINSYKDFKLLIENITQHKDLHKLLKKHIHNYLETKKVASLLVISKVNQYVSN